MAPHNYIVKISKPTDIPILNILCDYFDSHVGYIRWEGSFHALVESSTDDIQINGLCAYNFKYRTLEDLGYESDENIDGAEYGLQETDVRRLMEEEADYIKNKQVILNRSLADVIIEIIRAKYPNLERIGDMGLWDEFAPDIEATFRQLVHQQVESDILSFKHIDAWWGILLQMTNYSSRIKKIVAAIICHTRT